MRYSSMTPRFVSRCLHGPTARFIVFHPFSALLSSSSMFSSLWRMFQVTSLLIRSYPDAKFLFHPSLLSVFSSSLAPFHPGMESRDGHRTFREYSRIDESTGRGPTCSLSKFGRRTSMVAHTNANQSRHPKRENEGTCIRPIDMGEKKDGMRRRSSGALGSAGQLVRSSSVKHLELLMNGDFHLEIKFSYWVALSSLLYWCVAVAYFAYQMYLLGVLFVLIGIFSLLADSVLPHSKFVNSSDRLFATLGTLFSPVRLIFWCAKASFLFRIKVALMLLLSLAILNWSRSSTSQKEFVVRHTVWHAFSAAGLSYIAVMEGAGILSFEFLT